MSSFALSHDQGAQAVDTKVDGPVLRAIRMLRLFSEINGDISVKAASERLDLPISTTHRMLQLLASEGLIEQDEHTSHYRVGLDFIRMAALLGGQERLADIALPVVRSVVDACDEACMFVGYLPATYQVSIMCAVNSSHPLRYDMKVNAVDTVLWGATGRAILAFLPEEDQISAAMRGERSPSTREPLPPWPEFKRILSDIREAGFVKTEGQKIPGAVGMGAPVFKSGGRVVGSLCITIPQMRYNQVVEGTIVELLKSKARELSILLGA